jgi:hypothetical protein
MKVSDALNIAKSFAIVQLNADIESLTFVSARSIGTVWQIVCALKETNATTPHGTIICISDKTGEVISFTSQTIKELV